MADVPRVASVDVDLVIRSVRWAVPSGQDLTDLTVTQRLAMMPTVTQLMTALQRADGVEAGEPTGGHYQEYAIKLRAALEDVMIEVVEVECDFTPCSVTCGGISCVRPADHAGLHLTEQGREWAHPTESSPLSAVAVGVLRGRGVTRGMA